jgi:hypothetical protein
MNRVAVLLVCLLAAAPLRADVCHILSWDAGSVTVEFTSSTPGIDLLESEGRPRLCRISLPGFVSSATVEGAPLLPLRRFLFAIPSERGVRLDILETDVYPIDGFIPAPYTQGSSREEQEGSPPDRETIDQGEFVKLIDVGTYRKQPIAVVEVTPVLFDPSGPRLLHAHRIVARISFPPVQQAARSPRPAGLIGSAVVNSDQVSTWGFSEPQRSAQQRTPFEFALSGDWVKIGVREKGIYIITYNDFISAGINPAQIDPSSMRLFSTPPYPQPDSIDGGGSFEEGFHLTEHAMLYRGAASTQFMPNDTIFFYGLGVNAWADDIDPERSHRLFVEHPYETRNVYWLTWGGDFTGPPARMDERSVSSSSPYDYDVTSYEARLHIEQDEYYDPIYTDDRWYWQMLDAISHEFSNAFSLNAVVGSQGVIRTQAYGPYNFLSYNTADYEVNGVKAGWLGWLTSYSYNPVAIPILETGVSNLVEGGNTFVARKTLGQRMYVLWYEVFYQRLLKAVLGSLDFYAPTEIGSARFAVDGYQDGALHLFDVTNHESPVLLTQWRRTAGGAEFVDLLDAPPKHYMAVHASSTKHAALEWSPVTSLRDDPACPDMLVVYHERFSGAASALRNARSEGIPYAPDPYVRAVDIDAVYDNFSGGRKDPIAIRNYLKFLYDSFSDEGGPILKYVLLVGNGTYDTRDIIDFIPFYMNRYYYGPEGVEDDDFLVKLDEGHDNYPDIAIGRLSVLNEREADNWVDRIVRYGGNIDLGPWRNKVILVADDESIQKDEYYFMNDAEDMSADDGQFPRFVDFKKVYLHNYPKEGFSKPAAKRDLLESWSDGALIVNYAGHGSPKQMADEYVMEVSDIDDLTNGNRRPLVLSFSCSTGDLASPDMRSLSQVMCTDEGGGAIATMSAVGESIGPQNTLLNREVVDALFTSRDSTATEPIGYAFLLAKARSVYVANNSKYALLGDPAMKLALPTYTVEHDIASIDTLYTGHRYRVEGSVVMDGRAFTSFNGIVDMIVQEAEKHSSEIVDIETLWVDIGHTQIASIETTLVQYSLPGNELFRGTADVASGRFSLDFVVPSICRTGPDARVRSYVMSSSIDGIGACNSLALIPADTIPADEGPPRIHLYFANQATRVKAGARLIAELSDEDGIAILGTNPQNSIFLEFDDNGFPIFVTESFRYDHGSSTEGRIEYALQSGFESGPHSVILRAFDNLGASSTDTLQFEMIDEGLFTVSDVFNFPNPFREGTNFVFQLSTPAEVHLGVYTVSGVKIWERTDYAEEGFNSIYWDGRDSAGDRPANGTYLYVLEVEFRESFHRKESVKGKAVLLR